MKGNFETKELNSIIQEACLSGFSLFFLSLSSLIQLPPKLSSVYAKFNHTEGCTDSPESCRNIRFSPPGPRESGLCGLRPTNLSLPMFSVSFVEPTLCCRLFAHERHSLIHVRLISRLMVHFAHLSETVIASGIHLLSDSRLRRLFLLALLLSETSVPKYDTPH